MITKPVNTHAVATTAVVCMATFPVVVLALNLVQAFDGYDVRTQAVSELALGHLGWLMALAFCAGGIGTFLVAVLLRRTIPGAVIRPALLTVAAVCTALSAVFRTDGESASTSTHGQVHIALGIASFLTQLLCMAICSMRFRHELAWRPLTRATRALTLLGFAGFACVPALGASNFGLAQRILIGSLVGWTILAASWARRIPDPTPSHAAPVGARPRGRSSDASHA